MGLVTFIQHTSRILSKVRKFIFMMQRAQCDGRTNGCFADIQHSIDPCKPQHRTNVFCFRKHVFYW